MPQSFHPLNERYVGEVFNARTQPALVTLIWERDRKYTMFPHRAWQKEHVMAHGAVIWPQIDRKPEVIEGHSGNYRYQPVRKLVEGDRYFAPNPLMSGGLHEGVWEGTIQQREWRDYGLIYRDPNAARTMLQKILTLSMNEA